MNEFKVGNTTVKQTADSINIKIDTEPSYTLEDLEQLIINELYKKIDTYGIVNLRKEEMYLLEIITSKKD